MLPTTPGRSVHLVVTIGRWALVALFGVAGSAHFFASEFFTAIMPPYVPWHLQIVWLSGTFEIAGALGLTQPKFRRAAGIGLILMAVAVFPANLHMALHASDYNAFPAWLLYLRLPLQLVILFWIWRCAVRQP